MRQYILNDEDKAVIALVTQANISYAKAKYIIEALDDVSVIFSADRLKYAKIKDKDTIEKLSNIDVDLVNNYIANLDRSNIEVITYVSQIYPDNLREIHNPPLVLYAKGNLDLLVYKNNLSIVGTRRATSYGEEVTKSFAKTLAKEGICIVSGLADGIDTIAHQGAVSVKGKTIAVMGSGFNNIYPANNIGLVDKIVETGGLVITEYKSNELPQTYHFPARNRIIAGLSLAVLIVEAPARSGALITKEYALECNREIFVVPGRITDIYSKGSNEIIKSCQSTMVLSVNDILEFFGRVGEKKSNADGVQLSLEEQLIIEILGAEEVHYEKIIAASGLSSSTLNSLLIKLELKNIIKKLPGNIYTRIGF